MHVLHITIDRIIQRTCIVGPLRKPAMYVPTRVDTSGIARMVFRTREEKLCNAHRTAGIGDHRNCTIHTNRIIILIRTTYKNAFGIFCESQPFFVNSWSGQIQRLKYSFLQDGVTIVVRATGWLKQSVQLGPGPLRVDRIRTIR